MLWPALYRSIRMLISRLIPLDTRNLFGNFGATISLSCLKSNFTQIISLQIRQESEMIVKTQQCGRVPNDRRWEPSEEIHCTFRAIKQTFRFLGVFNFSILK